MENFGNKEIFKNNLNYYIYIKKKTRDDIAKALGVPYSTVASWCNGLFYPRIDKIEMLANYLGIQKSDLVEDRNKKSNIINVYSSVHAGILSEMIEDIVDTEEISEKMASSDKTYFGIKVKGDSMSPKYIENDTLIVEKSSTCNNGDDCIVAINGNEAFLKRVYINENGITLQALNPNYEPLIYTNKQIKDIPITIIGIVRELRRKIWKNTKIWLTL